MTRRSNLTWYSGLAILAGITGFNVLWNLSHAARSGWYSMVADSMSRNWHNFFFGSADPGGFVALDKIPGSYWVPALLVKALGFHNSAVIAPNGIATILVVMLVALAGKRLGGVWAGLLAGLAIAATPIAIAVARSNEPESAFLLTTALAAYAITVALQTQRRFHLILAGLAIAAGFQQYMVVAWAIWPALALGWWFGTKRSWRKKLVDLLIAGSISLAVSLVWIVAVSLTPASKRPYIGSTLHNNPWEMVFGYNGLGRFMGGKMQGTQGAGSLTFNTFVPPFSGHASVMRLFYHQVIGQISWMIPASIIAIVYLAMRGRHKPHLIAFSVWLLTFGVMFSAVSGMHQYYTAPLAIPMALLVSTALREAYLDRDRWWLLAFATSTVAMAGWIVALNPHYLSKILPIAAFLLAGFAFLAFWKAGTYAVKPIGAAVLVATMFVTPMAWAVDAKNHPSFVNPMAGPPDSYTLKLAHKSASSVTGYNTGTTFTSNKGINHKAVLKWLLTRPHGKVLLVTFGANIAAPYVIVDKKVEVLPVGGFNGNDPVPTLEQFKALVAAHQINYVQMNNYVGDEPQNASWVSHQIKSWVTANCLKNETPPARVTLFYCRAK